MGYSLSMTAVELQALIDAANAAMLDVMTGQAQSVSIAGRTVTKSNLTEINNVRKGWERELAGLAAEGRPTVIAFRNPLGGVAIDWDRLP